MSKTSTDDAISIVFRCLGRLDCRRYWRKNTFSQMVYTRWAYLEIVDYLRSHRDIPPIMAVEELQSQMNEYACVKLETSVIFSIAYDVCEEIIELLM